MHSKSYRETGDLEQCCANWLNSCPTTHAYFLSVPTGKISISAYTKKTIKKLLVSFSRVYGCFQ